MKIKNFKYVLGSVFKWLFMFFILLWPIIVNWACETEDQALRNCNNRLTECTMCQNWSAIQWLNCDGCDHVIEIGCDSQQTLYNTCLTQQSSGGWEWESWWSNNEQWSNWQSSNQWWTQSNGWWQSQNWWTNQWNWWNNTCHHLLQSGWTCDLGYRTWTASDGTACCVLVCWWSDYLSWDVNWSYTCESCVPGETKPNESHTRCICDPNFKCCWVQLNNTIPFIWDCIEMNAESNRDNTTNVNSVTAFPILMQWLMKILMSVIMIFSFLMIIVAWLMIVSWAFGWNWFATGKKIIKNVIISLILLWCSWLILSLINPSFFGG